MTGEGRKGRSGGVRAAVVLGLIWLTAPIGTRGAPAPASVLADQLLITWYGNPRNPRMGVLGEYTGAALADGLRAQAAAFVRLTPKRVVMAYHLVAVVAQCTAGVDDRWRRRESASAIRDMLAAARANGFRLVLDVQPGRSTVGDEVAALEPFLAEPDVYLALDPEFQVADCEIPGRTLGHMAGADVNRALDTLERVIARGGLPPKVLIVHQFRVDMLPDKPAIRKSALVDVVLNMDGFGSQALKRSSYRAIMRQGQFPFAGIKVFYQYDDPLLAPADIMALKPVPSVIIYQ